jgi:hypothetical protein
MKDGLILMYVKDEVIYPVALTQEEYETLQFMGSLFSPLTIVKDKPQGAAINLIKDKNEVVQ